jgi:hypothetical protein
VTHYRTDKGDRGLIPWDEIIVEVKEDPTDDRFELVETRSATVNDVLAAMTIKKMLDEQRERQRANAYNLTVSDPVVAVAEPQNASTTCRPPTGSNALSAASRSTSRRRRGTRSPEWREPFAGRWSI